MNVLFATSEALPFVKTGGLGDVAGSLPAALAEEGVNICVFLPFYGFIKNNESFGIEYLCNFSVPLAWRQVYAGLFKKTVKAEKTEVVYYFIDNDYYFDRSTYGYDDDGERFAFFDKAVLEAISYIDFAPDILHCNDWQTGYIPLFLKAHYSHIDKYKNIKTLYTIHNIEYQGKANMDFADNVLGVDEFWHQSVFHDNMANAAKAAIVLSDRVSTVSETYAHEIKHEYFSYGLSRVLNENAHKLSGILNGIDVKTFNPETDVNIKKNYSHLRLSGKKENKIFLQNMLGLEENAEIPVFAIISRLVSHKGIELVAAVYEELVSMDIQLVILGTGDKQFEDLFKYMEYKYKNKVSSNIMFDNVRASQVYAGADFLLMPSKSEPCGLSQLIAMRYGTIPIVRETGGLFDTVTPVNETDCSGNGFTFKTYNAHDMLDAVKRAAGFFRNKEGFNIVRKNIMQLDLSWNKKAKEYIDLYKKL